MSSEISKQIALQASHQPTMPRDPTLESIMQSIMVDDVDVKRILKGEITEPLDQFRTLTVSLSHIIVTAPEPTAMAEIANMLVQIKPLQEKIAFELQRYYEVIPLLFMLSPLMRLSNISEKKARSLCSDVDIVLGRMRLMTKRRDDSLLDINILDSVRMLIHMAIWESVAGWKARVVTEEKRTVQTVITDQTAQRKKHWYSI